MGITYQMDPEIGLVVERWEGVITADIVRDHWEAFFPSDDYLRFDRILVSLQEATPGFLVEELLPLITTLVTPYRKQRKHWNALYVATHEQEYLAELYLTFSGEAGVSRIFKDRTSAIEWLRNAR